MGVGNAASGCDRVSIISSGVDLLCHAAICKLSCMCVVHLMSYNSNIHSCYMYMYTLRNKQ
jgi:hypothetical protein